MNIHKRLAELFAEWREVEAREDAELKAAGWRCVGSGVWAPPGEPDNHTRTTTRALRCVREGLCPRCQGSKVVVEPDRAIIQCPTCNGSGKAVSR